MRAYFCFHYQPDIWRVNQIRSHWLSFPGSEAAGFWDPDTWEERAENGDAATMALIDTGLNHTQLTFVLIGTNTFKRRWVRYELLQSLARGNAIVGIHINSLPDIKGNTLPLGENPLDYVGFYVDRQNFRVDLHEWANEWKRCGETAIENLTLPIENTDGARLSHFFKTYDWVNDNGTQNMSTWVDEAVSLVSRESQNS